MHSSNNFTQSILYIASIRVRPQTSNGAVLGDLGRIPLSLICKQRTLKFWNKIMLSPDSLIFNIYQKYVNDTVFSNSNRRTNWFTAVKQYVDDLGCIDVWNNSCMANCL